MAWHTVFGTTELLEGILSFLPLPDLLRVQAVSKRWRNVITSSSALQEKLFYKAEKPEHIWLVDVTNLPSGAGPLPRRYETELWVKASVPIDSDDAKEHYGLSVMPVRINPLCLLEDGDDIPKDVDFTADLGTTVFFYSDYGQSACWDFARNASNSCQRMLLTQPPVQYVTLESSEFSVDSYNEDESFEEASTDSSHKIAGCKIFVESGVTVRDVVSRIEKAGKEALEDNYTIRLHGAIEVTDGFEEVVDERTKEWREELAILEESSIV